MTIRTTKMFFSALLLSGFSVPAWSANVRYEGVPVTERITRSGKDMSNSAHVSRSMQTQVNRIVMKQQWTSERIPMPSCRATSGNGSGDWKGFWDASDPTDKARRLALAVAGLGDDGAKQIIQDGFFKTLPGSWNEFVAEIRRADNNSNAIGYSSRVIGAYAEQNKKNLGYVDHQPRIGGDGDWQGYWDASMSDRPARLERALRGLSAGDAQLIVFSNALDRLPRDWRSFADAIANADTRAQRGFSYTVLVKNGEDNMRRLGYYDADACSTSSATERVLKNEEVREFDHSVQRQFEIELSNAPLLKGESETMTLSFDGINDSVSVSSPFYRYQQTRDLDSSGAAAYKFIGQRQLVEPVNTVGIVVTKANGKVALDLTDSAADGDFTSTTGDVVVTVEIWQSRFLFDKKLGTMQIKLPAVGQPYHFDTQIAPNSGAKVYAYYSIQRTGSRFYSAQASKQLYSEKVQF